ncbi:MAG: right-handed parallel beta-helix repeat-containing protein, partial [Candidatus Woesearchaeota archaeon]
MVKLEKRLNIVLFCLAMLLFSSSVHAAGLIFGGATIPLIDGGYTIPEKAVPGETLQLFMHIADPGGVDSVVANFTHEKGGDIVALELYNGTSDDGYWKAEWVVHDTLVKDYSVEVIADNGVFQSFETVWWSDPIYPFRARYPSGYTCSSGTWRLGIKFSVTEAVQVESLCGYWSSGAHTVFLQQEGSYGSNLRSASVTSSGSWSCTAITPITLNPGINYFVAQNAAGGSYCYTNHPAGSKYGVNFAQGGVYQSGAGTYFTSAPTPDSAMAYGMVDIGLTCTTPSAGMTISAAGITRLCGGNYNLNDATGVIRIGNNNVNIMCGETILTGSGIVSGRAFYNPGYDGVTIEGCTTYEYLTAFYMGPTVTDAVFRDNTIYRPSNGFYSTNDNHARITIENNEIYTANYGFRVYVGGGDLVIQDNRFSATECNYIYYGDNHRVLNNNFTDLNGSCGVLYMIGYSGTNYNTGSVIENNRFSGAPGNVLFYLYYYLEDLVISNNTIDVSTSSTLYMSGNSYAYPNRNILVTYNNFIDAGYRGINFENYVNSSTISYNNISGPLYYDVRIGSTSGGNVIYGNRFLSAGTNLAEASNYNNHFNRTVGGVAQGNYWADVIPSKLNIQDANLDLFGDSGSQYPYRYSKGGDVNSYVIDYGPILVDSDGDGTPDNVDCGPNDPNIRAPRANLTITSNTIFCPGTYSLNDSSGGSGLIRFGASGITLTCNGTVIIGNGSGLGINDYGYDN